jgi:CspA family cold shock protein
VTEREVGQVKWFSQEKGYGFIKRENGQPDAFVHMNDFRNRQDVYWVKEGDSLEFTVEQREKGPRAVEVAVV